jgi:hypothetical protein
VPSAIPPRSTGANIKQHKADMKEK